ncbi:MAG: hypothetical protein K2I21_08830, partial [Acetatifactor sp.]|nr:hypothetical protein [Acetatifactor sp.]
MKRKWGRLLCIMLAGSMLAGCGNRPGGVEPLTADGEVTQGRQMTVGDGQDQPLDAGDAEPVRLADNGGWDCEDDSSVEALRNFSWQLMLQNMDRENPILSPVSAYLALGMVGMGAQGETEQEFRDMLGDNMPAVSRKLMERYPQEQEGMVLTIANSAWVDQQLTPDKQWVTDMEEIFRGKGYRGILSSQEIMEQINAWCSENTRGLIPKMLGEPLSGDARLALLDAVYFKGDWVIPFEAMDTAPRPFTREDGTEKQVDTMSMWETNQRYLHSGLGEGVLLPYQGGEFAYVAILPNEGSEVRELYRQLTPEALAELLESESRELC